VQQRQPQAQRVDVPGDDPQALCHVDGLTC